MAAYLLAVEQTEAGDKEIVVLKYAQENSESTSKFDAAIFPSQFFEFLYAINDEFKRLCVIGDVGYAITGFRVRDADKGARTEIQFIVNINAGLFIRGAKTNWREMRDIPLNNFGSEESTYKIQAEAMNSIIAVFNELQEYVRERIADWLEMKDNDTQLSLFERKEIEDKKYKKASSFNAIEKFRDSMQAMSDKDGLTMTISSSSGKRVEIKPKGSR